MLDAKQSRQLYSPRFDSRFANYIYNNFKYIIYALILLLFLSSDVLAVQKVMTWKDNSNNELGFVVQVCPGTCIATSAGWKELIKVAADVGTLIIDVADNTVVSYRVGAYDASGVNFSNIFVDRFNSPIAPTLTSLLNQACKTVTLTQTSPGVWKSVCY